MKVLGIVFVLSTCCSILLQAQSATPSKTQAFLKPLLPFNASDIDVNKEFKTGLATINPADAGSINELRVKFKNIDVPASSDTAVFGVANSGTTVGTYRDSNAIYHGFIRSSSGNVTTLDDPQGQNTILRGISPDGNYVVGGYFSKNVTDGVGFIVQNGTLINLSPPGSTSSQALGIHDSGKVVGENVDANGNGNGYYFDGANYTTLDVPNGVGSAAVGINNGGLAGHTAEVPYFRFHQRHRFQGSA